MLVWAGSENRGISAIEMEGTVGQSVLCNEYVVAHVRDARLPAAFHCLHFSSFRYT